MTAWKDMGTGLRALLIGGGAAAVAVVAAVVTREGPVPDPVATEAPAAQESAAVAPPGAEVVADAAPTGSDAPVAPEDAAGQQPADNDVVASLEEPATEVATSEPQVDAGNTAEDKAASAQPPATTIIAPSFDVVRVAPDGSAVIAGNAEAGATVSVKVDGAEVATTSADGRGAFVSLFDLEPSDAARVVTLSARTPGGADVPSDASVLIAPSPQPAADAIETPDASASSGEDSETANSDGTEPDVVASADGAAPAEDKEQAVETGAVELATSEPEPEPEAPAAVLLTDEGAKVLQPAVPDADVARNVTIDAITYSAAGDVQLTGRGSPQASVRLYVDNRSVLDRRVASDGTWAATLPALAAGVYALRADELGSDGRVLSRYETPFQREAPDVLAAAGDNGSAALKITVQPGFTLWRIARESYGDGVMYVRVYDANKDQIRDPDLIYPGQVFTVPSGE